MHPIFALFAAIFLTCSSAHAQDTLQNGPFAGTDLSTLAEQDVLVVKEANEDFLLVVAGQRPKYAQLDVSVPRPADGGTAFYRGRQYRLTVVQSLSSFGGLNGYIYGPIIQFDNDFAPGNYPRVESLSFYSYEKFKTLREYK